METSSIIALILSGLALVGGGLTMFFKVVQHLTRIEDCVKYMKPLVQHVPALSYRVYNIERHLDISSPELPTFTNGKS